MKSNPPIVSDSSALFSLAVKSDQNNQLAINASKNLLLRNVSIIIPSEIFSETINILGKKANKELAVDTAKEILSSTEVFVIEPTDDTTRLSALTKFKDLPSSVSFTDCLVMAWADKLGTKEVFGFDETFRKNGYLRIGIDS